MLPQEAWRNATSLGTFVATGKGGRVWHPTGAHDFATPLPLWLVLAFWRAVFWMPAI